MKTKILLPLFLLMLPFFCIAQNSLFTYRPDSAKRATALQEISQGLDDADLVVEGKAIKWKGIWNKTYTQVFTSYTVIVYKLFKGKLASDTIEIVCRGGRLEKGDTLSDITSGMRLSHNDPLGANEEGVFFLHYNDWNAQIKEVPNSFILWHDFRIKYLYDYVRFFPPAGCRDDRFKDIPEVYAVMNSIQKKPYQVITENPHDKEIFKSKK